MKKIVLPVFTALALIYSSVSHGQRLHAHIMAGTANYNGDLQARRYTLSQSQLALSGGLTFELTEKLYLRGEISYAKVGADDKFGKTQFQLRRNLSFQSVVYEGNLLAEYDILNINERRIVPYVFAGVGLFHFSPYTYDSVGRKTYLQNLGTEGQGLPEYGNKPTYSKLQLNIPLGAGIKFALSENIRVGLEIGLRYLFTDYLDDVSGTYVDLDILRAARGSRSASLSYRGDELKPAVAFPGAGRRRGNSGAKDFYYFSMVRFSYRLPFEIFGSGSSGSYGKSSVACPRF
ncbi:DUF6089 family protein [Foetidibacter luteolus]|uniref:DUF6089 family protein n=1 Tax=Foetidibacter luteolus TaxID=2608880 RepID=UPI00129B6EA6|nr:DUF6089 family protein [Foetidibacter luteolus]